MALRKFTEIVKLAEKHHGKAGLAKRLAENAKKPTVKKKSDDRYIAAMSQAVFSAGFSWDVIEKKWPGSRKRSTISTRTRSRSTLIVKLRGS